MTKEQNIFTKEIVYTLDGMDEVSVQKDLEYSSAENSELSMDVYYPKDHDQNSPKPAVIFVTGYPDPGFQAMMGLKLKEVAQYQSWARLMAAAGFVAITYTNTDPVSDINTLLQFLVKQGAALGIDKDRIGIWACSGNTPNAISLLMNGENPFIRCAVLCYGYMPDIDDSRFTSDCALQFHFVNPLASIPAQNLDWQPPLLIVRCGQDQMPNLSASIDRFVEAAKANNRPLSVINLPHASHAFDVMDDQEYSYQTIKDIVSFFMEKII